LGNGRINTGVGWENPTPQKQKQAISIGFTSQVKDQLMIFSEPLEFP